MLFVEQRRNTRLVMSLLVLFCLVAVAAAVRAPDSQYDVNFDEHGYEPHEVIHRDVCIIGGGATGTYAAIRLRDSGETVVVVEPDTVLGGQTRSYNVPGSDEKIDYGVLAYTDVDIVHEFFGRFDIPLTDSHFHSASFQWADFRTGEYIPNFAFPSASLDGYKAQLEKYPYLEWTSDLPDPVPEDLAMPFGDFAKKYSLEDVIPQLYFNMQGPGNIPELSTYYIFQAISSQLLKSLSTHLLFTERGNNHEIYAKALEELGEDVLLSSNVVGAQRLRGGSGVNIIVMTPSGIKLIKAKKLLVTMPPTMSNMAPFDLDETESSLFSQFNSQSWYVALVTNTSFPRGMNLQNAAPYVTSTFSTAPSLHVVLSTKVPGIYLVKYRSTYPLPEALVESEIRATVARLGMPTSDGVQKTAADIEVLAYHAHVPFDLTVSPEAFRNGFNHKLNSLQGHRNTWYTGSTFLSPHSAALWNFTEGLLPRIMHGL